MLNVAAALAPGPVPAGRAGADGQLQAGADPVRRCRRSSPAPRRRWSALVVNVRCSTLGVPLAVLTRAIAPVTEELLKLLFVVYADPPQARRIPGRRRDPRLRRRHRLRAGRERLVPQRRALGRRRPCGSCAASARRSCTARRRRSWRSSAQTLAGRRPQPGLSVFVPGALAAIALHAVYNQFVLPPVVATLVLHRRRCRRSFC